MSDTSTASRPAARRWMRHVQAVLGVVLVAGSTLVACDSGTTPLQDAESRMQADASGLPTSLKTGPADAANAARPTCIRALPARALAGASPTTIGEIRDHTVGPGRKPAATAFAGLSADASGSWCWIRSGNGFDVYGVARDRGDDGRAEAVHFGTIDADVARSGPSGPPVIP